MNEVEVLRREFESVPEPADTTVLAVRAKLLAEIESCEAGTARRRPRRKLRLPAVVAIGLAGLLAIVLVLVLPRERGLTGTEIAAAAYKAIAPPQGVIRHMRFVTGVANGRHHEVTEEWVASGPFVVHQVYRHPAALSGQEWESSQCGSVSFDPRLNLLNVAVSRARAGGNTADIQQHTDPIASFLVAYRRGQVRYRGQTTFHGVPAYKLVVSGGPRTTVTYIVRRDNYYPLQKVVRTRAYVWVTTYSNFADVPRNAGTEHLLHVGPHPDAFLLHGGGFHPRGACAGFGSYDSLTGKGKKP